jgi:hypothetical protein
MALLLAAALALVLLHRADGGTVTIAANHVTSLRETPGSLGKQVPDATRCLVGLTDGKFVAVLETCTEVRRLLEAASRPQAG